MTTQLRDTVEPSQASPAESTSHAKDASARVRVTARAMICIQIAVVAIASMLGYWYGDDFVIRGTGAVYSWFSPQYLLQQWGGHFMPAGFAVAQVQGKLGGFSYFWVALTLVAGQAIVSVLLYRMLVRHFGLRWRILVVLGLYLLSIPVLQATLWWASALNAVPLLACLVVVADHTLRTADRRRWGQYVWVLATTATALAFFEKAVLIPFVVVMLLLSTTDGGGLVRSVGLVVRRHWPLLIGLIAVLGGWYVAYRSNTTSQFVSPPSLAGLSDQLSSGFVSTFVPSLVGGPWSWVHLDNGNDVVDTPSWLALLLAVLVAVVVIVLMSAGSRARRALCMVGGYALLAAVLVNLGRPQFVSVTAGLPRYYADVTLVTCLALALATTRLRADTDESMLVEPTVTPGRRQLVAGVVVLQLLLLSWGFATVRVVTMTAEWQANPWVSTALRSLHEAKSSAPILNQQVPPSVLWAVVQPYNDYDKFFAGVRGAPAFADTTDTLRVFDETGALVPGHLEGPRSVAPVGQTCPYRVASSVVSVPLKADVIAWSHSVQIAYIASQDTDLEVSLSSGPTVTIHALSGLHDVFLNTEGGGTSVRLRATNLGASVCVSLVRVGRPTPGVTSATAD